jgi:CPA1 family monovalent cation:H+ antiporter
MSVFEILAVVITLTALLGYANERVFRLPPTIGVLLGGLLVSLLLVALSALGVTGPGWAEGLLAQIDFDALLMQGLLSFLLFAGALHINVNELLSYRWTILILATLGVVVSTLFIGTVMYAVLHALGLPLPLSYAFLFGALISPTDPIAVLGILKRAGAPKSLEVIISGESLFNDGVGVVVFTLIAGLALGGAGHGGGAGAAAGLFFREAVGGVAYGLALGYAAYRLLCRVDNYTVEILITLAVVTGGYALAGRLHTSGPIAIVVAGILVGNHGRHFAMSDRTREHLDTFWRVIDETLNAVLFVLLGLELLVLDLTPRMFVAALAAIPVVLAARLISVGPPISLLRMRARFVPYTIRLMTWGGLRGGIAVALALSLPDNRARDLILGMTYAVVVFSILVQGLTVAPMARRATAATAPPLADGSAPDVFLGEEPGFPVSGDEKTSADGDGAAAPPSPKAQ